MHDFRFQRSWRYHETVLEEFAGERAFTMGIIGRRLDEALAHYRAVAADGTGDAEQIGAAFKRARDAAWALVVQRECAGFRSPNLNWLRETWQVPEEILRQI